MNSTNAKGKETRNQGSGGFFRAPRYPWRESTTRLIREKEQIMKNFKQLAVFVIFAALSCAGLRAQDVYMRAAIPFDFHAGGKLMPAGEYIIHEQGHVVFLRTWDKPGPALITFGVSNPGPYPKSKLDFNRYGNEYFLTTIWDSYAQDGRQVPRTDREKELAKRGNTPVPAVVTVASSK